MGLNVFISIITICLTPQLVDNRDISFGSVSTENSPTANVPFDPKLRNCASSITISSCGHNNIWQGSVLGTYNIQNSTFDKWPTWKMEGRDDRYLYRCPCGKKWLIGRWNWASVGWIKHPNCTDCPENCSKDWQYWKDDDVLGPGWYFDRKMNITKNDWKDNCSFNVWEEIQKFPTGMLIFTALLIRSIVALYGGIFYHYSCCKKRVPKELIASTATYSAVIVLLVVLLVLK